jgi:hypothetical protein
MLVGVAARKLTFPSVDGVRMITGHLTSAEENAGARGAATGLSAEYGPYALQGPRAGDADSRLAESATAHADENGCIEDGKRENESQAASVFDVALGPACPE